MTAVDHICSAFLRRMRELGLNQFDLARRMHVSCPYVTRVLRQDVTFSFRTCAVESLAIRRVARGRRSSRGAVARGRTAKLAKALEMDFIPDLKERKTDKL